MKLVYITLSQIEALHPCEEALRDVRQFFGERKRVRVTVKAAVAVAQRFNFCWLVLRTLRSSARAVYTEALADARADRNRSKADARAEYDKATADAWGVYDQSAAPAWSFFGEATAAAQAAFVEAEAAAWARAYIGQEQEQRT